MPKFFVDRELISDTSVTLLGDDAYHIARALRMAVGDEINVSDGCGRELVCRLTKIRDGECTADIIAEGEKNAESPVDITLFMAMPKGDKLEVVVQKAVELGAVSVVPFESERCIKRPSPEKAAKLTERLSRIAREAAKQCGRSRLPEVGALISLLDMTNRLKSFDLSLFCYENEGEKTLKKVLEESRTVKTVAVIVGAEGGFSPAEAERIKAAGGISVGLGPRILRCETAPDYALSVLSYHFEL